MSRDDTCRQGCLRSATNGMQVQPRPQLLVLDVMPAMQAGLVKSMAAAARDPS